MFFGAFAYVISAGHHVQVCEGRRSGVWDEIIKKIKNTGYLLSLFWVMCEI